MKIKVSGYLECLKKCQTLETEHHNPDELMLLSRRLELLAKHLKKNANEAAMEKMNELDTSSIKTKIGTWSIVKFVKTSVNAKEVQLRYPQDSHPELYTNNDVEFSRFVPKKDGSYAV